MFDKILIANRGEIAVRIIRTCRRLGIATVVVYSEADAGSLAVEMADEAVAIGPAPAAQSYLVADKIVDAVRRTGAQAVHPGFGFLSEKPEFAERLAAEKIVFIGPNAHAIHAMGDKIESKRTAAAAGVSTVPGFLGEIGDVAQAVEIAEGIGYPVMIKASAGGGGKGIRIAENRREVEEGFPLVRAEAKNAFGDDRVFIEKFIINPRHIEIQVLGDKHGTILHLNERECSIQRRNQKVIEEAPSPLLDPATRARMGAEAVALARAVGYDSAGTVEFVASGADRSFYFLEMNTRLQVEHPVTEMITGIDLVEQMIRVAAGERLGITQADVGINGWAMESRIYAEDPYRGFLPSIGRLRRFAMPVEGKLGPGVVRLDSGVREGDEISMFYDPMIAKLITHAPTRAEAITAHGLALEQIAIEGIQDNSSFVAAVMDEPTFQSGDITTGYIKHRFPQGFAGAAPLPQADVLFAAVAAHVHAVRAGRDSAVSGRIAPAKPLRTAWSVLLDGSRTEVEVQLTPEGSTVRVADGDPLALTSAWTPGEAQVRVHLGHTAATVGLSVMSEGYRLRWRGMTRTALVFRPKAADLRALIPEKPRPDLSKRIVSPMPGLVVTVDVVVGQEVKAGEAVCVVEAMKMQNIIRAEADGKVKAVHASAGASVAADEVLIEFG